MLVNIGVYGCACRSYGSRCSLPNIDFDCLHADNLITVGAPRPHLRPSSYPRPTPSPAPNTRLAPPPPGPFRLAMLRPVPLRPAQLCPAPSCCPSPPRPVMLPRPAARCCLATCSPCRRFVKPPADIQRGVRGARPGVSHRRRRR